MIQKPTIAYDFTHKDLIKSNLTESNLLETVRDPIIFSKFKYLNQTRKVLFYI